MSSGARAGLNRKAKFFVSRWSQLLRLPNGGRNGGADFFLLLDAPHVQLNLPLLGRLDRPCVAPSQLVSQCRSYRDAVRMCWALRRVHHMTFRHLAVEAGIRSQVISDYLHGDDHPHRRDLPANRIAAFESVTGNTVITQWLAARQALTVLEELQASKALA